MRVRIPPLERSLRTASRHRSSPQPNPRFFAANAGRTTSLVTRQVAGSSPAGSIMGARSSVGRAGRLSKTSSPQSKYSGGNAGQDYIRFGTKRSWLLPCPATEQSWRMQMGIHRWRLRPAVRVRKFSSSLVAGTDQTGECRSDYMGEHLLRQEVGGSIPPLGNQVAQQECPATTRRPPFVSGECRRDYMVTPRSPVRVRPDLRVRSSAVRAWGRLANTCRRTDDLYDYH